MKIPFSKFILALKLFELEALRACKELGVAYNTVHSIFMLIREKIYKGTSKDDILQGEVGAELFWREKEERERGKRKDTCFRYRGR